MSPDSRRLASYKIYVRSVLPGLVRATVEERLQPVEASLLGVMDDIVHVCFERLFRGYSDDHDVELNTEGNFSVPARKRTTANQHNNTSPDPNVAQFPTAASHTPLKIPTCSSPHQAYLFNNDLWIILLLRMAARILVNGCQHPIGLWIRQRKPVCLSRDSAPV